jgi:CPA1 family monovalent cation:H+ antiporter
LIPPADAGREIVTGVLGTAIAASEPGPVVATVETFAVLLAIAAIVALAAQRIKLPYAVALVLVGLAVAIFDPQPGFEISPDIVLAVLLPGLVFEAAYQIDVRELRRSFGWVVVLAAPGVVVSAAIVAIVLNLAAGLPLDVAFVVGAIVSATDPVAVVAIFRRLHSPARLSTLVEAESLFNDGTAIVVFTIALAAIGGGLAPVDGILAFVATVLISIAIGVVAGLMASFVISRVDDHLIELTISLLLAYGTYLIADRFEESGVIATVVAGVTLGSLGRQFRMSERTRESIDLVWEFIAFVLNALTFLLIGVSVTVTDVGSALPAIAWGVGAVLVGRAVVVYGLLGIPARLLHTRAGARAIPVPWLHVLFWAGLRGAVAVALALSLPADFPQRGLVQGIVFGIVLFTLVVQGSTAELVVRRSGANAEAAAEAA